MEHASRGTCASLEPSARASSGKRTAFLVILIAYSVLLLTGCIGGDTGQPGVNFPPSGVYLHPWTGAVGVGVDQASPGLGGTPPYFPFLLRQPDCSLTQEVLDSKYGVVYQYQKYEDFLHSAMQVPTTADRFPNGCSGPTTGISSQLGAFLGKLSNGNVIVGMLSSDGVQIYLVSAAGAVVPSQDYPTIPAGGAGVFGVAAADINGDGNMDMVVASEPSFYAGTLAVFLGNGDGTFRNGQVIQVPLPQVNIVSIGLTIDDVNGDGKLDLVAVTEATSSSSGLTVFLGNRDGTFQATGLSGPVGAGGWSVITGNFNSDNYKDLATSSGQILLGNGDGTFRLLPQTLSTGLQGAVASADFNQDGKADLAFTNQNANTLDVYFGNGDGTFAYSASYPAIYGSIALQASDLDGDGNPDLFVGTADGGVYTWTQNSQGFFQSLLNYGNGTFGPSRAYYPGQPSPPLVTEDLVYDVADFSGDGKPDFVLVNGNGGPPSLSVLKGKGDGSFQQPGIQTPLSNPASSQGIAAVAAGDINGDGRPDAVFAWAADNAGDSPHISVSLSNGDGTFQSQKDYPLPAAVLSGFGPASWQIVNSMALADMNGDGTLDVVFLASPDGTPSASTRLYVMFNQGGALGSPQLVDSQPYMNYLAVKDVSGDGVADIVAVSEGNIGTGSAGNGWLYLGKGSGTFQSAMKLNAGMAYPLVLAIADVNGDGKTDVVFAGTASDGTGEVTTLLGSGGGAFQSGKTTAEPANNYFGTLSGIAIIQRSNGQADLLLGNCCVQSYILDLPGNGDGTFNTADAGNLFLGLGSRRLKIADLTGTGLPDLLLTSAGTTNIPSSVEVFIAPAASNTLTQLSSAAGGVAALSPGALASAFGSDLATGQPQSPALPWPASAEGTSVTVTDSTGASAQAPLTYVSSTQVNFRIPPNLATGPATVTVTSGDGTASSAQTTLTSLAPALFALNTSNLTAAVAVCVAAGGAQTAEYPYQAVNNTIAAQPLNLAACPETVLELYGTGLDNAIASGVHVTIGGTSASVLYAGPQGTYPGLDQINVVIPASLSGRGNVPIVLTAGGMTANTVNVTIQ